MRLTLRRIAYRSTYIVGRLSIDGVPFCDTLERNYTNGRDKNTAISKGSYRVRMDVTSPKFAGKAAYSFCRGKLPRLESVPWRSGILIHIGNKPTDSAGCILVGRNTIVGRVTDSTATFRALYDRLRAANSEIWIDIM